MQPAGVDQRLLRQLCADQFERDLDFAGQRAALLGTGDDAGSHPVLDAAGEIVAFQLGIYRAGAAVQTVVDADERGVAGKSFIRFHNSSPFECLCVRQRAADKTKRLCVCTHSLSKEPFSGRQGI